MRIHKGIRPHDIIILLKLTDGKAYRQVDLAETLYMSQSEVSDSLSRSRISGLVDQHNQVYVQSFMELIRYGLKYVFPVVPGRRLRGIPTGHSAPPLNEVIVDESAHVWPYHKGDVMGEEIIPLYKNQHLAALNDHILHQKLALVDAIRLRNPRTQSMAVDYLYKMLSDA